MDRVLVYSHEDAFLFELTEGEVYELRQHEEINGEHYLRVMTTTVLEKEQRVLTQDATGKWREWVVTSIDEEHANGTYMTGTYQCVWSLQHDMAVSKISRIPSNVPAEVALEAALSGTTRWEVGTCEVSTVSSGSMYRTTGWDGLSTLVKNWGGEIDADIGVGPNGVISRRVDLLLQVGSDSVTRRFDYGRDMVGIGRHVESDPLACRIVPLGKGVESGDGYGRKITIEDVNDGKDYLQNDSMVEYVRMPDGNGGWEYPTRYVENSDIDTPQALKEWGKSVLEEATTPKVTYTANVMQLSRAGMDVYGIALGDVVHCVDRAFCEDGLRVSGRVVTIEENLLDPTDTKVEIGYLSTSLVAASSGTFATMSGTLTEIISSGVTTMTSTYMRRLLQRFNDEINATGGYVYITDGHGLITYDKAVSDPLVGEEADKVVEVKGGSIRIANSRTPAGDWDWKTLIESGHIAIDLVTAARLVAGYIGSPSGNYWNLDTGEFRLASTAMLGDKTVEEAMDDVAKDAVDAIATQEAIFNLLTDNGRIQGLYMKDGQLYVNGTYLYGGTIVAGGNNNENGVILVKDGNGNTVITLDKDGESIKSGMFSLENEYTIGSSSTRYVMRFAMENVTLDNPFSSGNNMNVWALSLTERAKSSSNKRAEMYFGMSGGDGFVLAKNRLAVMSGDKVGSSTMTAGLSLTSYTSGGWEWTSFSLYAKKSSYTSSVWSDSKYVYIDGGAGCIVEGDFSVQSGYTKSKVAATKNYGERMLYCYETPTPMFGDVGSGTIGEDGICYVEIDDVFSETVNIDSSYQVFLQACGRGELWVEEKHPSYFVVAGSAGMRFDWEIKSSQRGFEQLRLEDRAISAIASEEKDVSTPESAYGDELDYVKTIESVYDEGLVA